MSELISIPANDGDELDQLEDELGFFDEISDDDPVTALSWLRDQAAEIGAEDLVARATDLLRDALKVSCGDLVSLQVDIDQRRGDPDDDFGGVADIPF